MSQLDDNHIIPGLSLEDRIAMFEGHIVPFGGHIKQKFTWGGKVKHDYNPGKTPICTKYSTGVTKAHEYLKPNQPAAKLRKSLHLYRKAEMNPSVRPEPRDVIKPFGADVKGAVKRNNITSKQIRAEKIKDGMKKFSMPKQQRPGTANGITSAKKTKI